MSTGSMPSLGSKNLFYLQSLKYSSEPLKRIELSTSSLPRKCSTPELQRLVKSRDFSQRALPDGRHRLTLRNAPAGKAGSLSDTSRSGRRGSNPRPTAWKAVALPTELLPRMHPGGFSDQGFAPTGRGI